MPEEELSEIWKAVESYKSGYEPDVEAGKERFKKMIEASEKKARVYSLPNRSKQTNWGYSLSIAAGLAIIAVIGFLISRQFQQDYYLVVSTAANEQKEVILPDGSTVLLNELSHLEIAWPKNEPSRIVNFQGEGFFDVFENPNRPFVVIGPTSQVTVLGTSFNYRDYPEEATADVEVVTGKVRFQVDKKSIRVTPKNRGEYRQNELSVRPSLDLNADSWTNQELNFRNSSLPSVIQDLERHFGITMNLTKSQISNCSFTTDFSNASLEEVLESLKTSFGVEIKSTEEGRFEVIGGQSCMPNF